MKFYRYRTSCEIPQQVGDSLCEITYIILWHVFSEDTVLSIEKLKDPVPEEYMSHKERYENSIRKACILTEVLQKLAVEESTLDVFR